MVSLLTFAGSQASSWETTNEAEIVEFIGNYNFVENFSTSDASAVRQIDSATDTGTGSEDTYTDLTSGGLSGSKLIKVSYTSISKVINSVSNDIGIPPIIKLAVSGIFVIIISLIVLGMIMRKNPDL